MENVLITGITGFVGTNLSDYLTPHFEVIGLSRNSNRKKKIISYKDLSSLQIANKDIFIHLAGKAHDLKKTTNRDEYFEVNTELTKRVFDKFLKSNSETFIFMSSVKAVADSVDGVLEESINPNPITSYGKSKLAAEEYILNQKISENKRVFILRPCMIHGPNNKGNLNLLYNFVSKGIPYPFGSYKNKRSFVSVENLCFIIKELIDNKDIKSGIYNISDDKPMSSIDLVKIIGEIVNKKVSILNIPKRLIVVLANIGEYIPLPINLDRLQKLTQDYIVSNKKIKSAIQKELPLSSEAGIKKTITSF